MKSDLIKLAPYNSDSVFIKVWKSIIQFETLFYYIKKKFDSAMWYYLDLVSCSFIQRTIQQLLRVTQFWKVIIRIIQITLMGKLEWHSIMLGLLSWPSLFPDYLFLCQVRFWTCFFVSFSFYYQFLDVLTSMVYSL